MAEVSYQVEENIEVEEYKNVLIKSTLGKRRPIDDLDRIKKMCRNANLILTARIGNKLVGIARVLTDFTFSAYLADLAVDQEYQRLGIEKKLIIEVKKECGGATVTLLAAPEAIEYYRKIGMSQYEYCFRLKDLQDLR